MSSDASATRPSPATLLSCYSVATITTLTVCRRFSDWSNTMEASGSNTSSVTHGILISNFSANLRIGIVQSWQTVQKTNTGIARSDQYRRIDLKWCLHLHPAIPGERRLAHGDPDVGLTLLTLPDEGSKIAPGTFLPRRAFSGQHQLCSRFCPRFGLGDPVWATPSGRPRVPQAGRPRPIPPARRLLYLVDTGV